MRLTPAQKAKIKRLAERKGSTRKAAVLEAVEHELDTEVEEEEESIEAQPGSVLERAQDLCGSVEGPEDLSTNPKYMEDYGKD